MVLVSDTAQAVADILRRDVPNSGTLEEFRQWLRLQKQKPLIRQTPDIGAGSSGRHVVQRLAQCQAVSVAGRPAGIDRATRIIESF